MKITNRISHSHPDFLLLIVHRPTDWLPHRLDDIPPAPVSISVTPVASYDEARDDLLRCNRLALRNNHPLWAVIETPHGHL